MYKDGYIHCPKNIMSKFNTIFIEKKSENLKHNLNVIRNINSLFNFSFTP